MSHATACPSLLSVCVVAHQAYGALSGSGGHLGGVETQTALLARWLAGRGHRVTMITWDEGHIDGTTIDGVRAIKLCRRDAGWRVARFVHPRWTSLMSALRVADAAVYYHNCAEYVTGQVALWCRSHGRKFVYSAASEADCDHRLPFLLTRRERVLYRIGLRRADRIVVQTETQRHLLRASFGLEAVTIPMPCANAGVETTTTQQDNTLRRRIAWIGRICHVKRPDRLLELAERCPDLSFDLVGHDDGSVYAREVLDRAERIPNVRIHGGVGRAEVSLLLRQTACLCCTSEIEGLPNTFLEAWSHGVPTLSTFDPDGVIQRYGLGEVADSAGEMAVRIRSLLDGQRWQRASDNAHRYYLATHTIDATMPRFEALFREVTTEGPVRP